MAKTLVGKVASLSVTPKGGSAIALTGVRTASLSYNPNLQEDFDPDDDAPYHYQGNAVKSITFSLRDYQLAVALISMPCITALSCVLNAPKTACAASGTTAITITGTNLVCTSEVPVNAAADGLPTEYSVTFTVSHVDGSAGSLTVE